MTCFDLLNIRALINVGSFDLINISALINVRSFDFINIRALINVGSFHFINIRAFLHELHNSVHNKVSKIFFIGKTGFKTGTGL